VPERKPFLLRLDPETFAALQAWAADDLRSVNGQVEFLLRRSLRDARRLPGRANPTTPPEVGAGAGGNTGTGSDARTGGAVGPQTDDGPPGAARSAGGADAAVAPLPGAARSPGAAP
jgi:hypothetical protein